LTICRTSLQAIFAHRRRYACGCSRRVGGRRTTAAAAVGAQHLVEQDATEALADETVDDDIDGRIEDQQRVAGDVSVAQPQLYRFYVADSRRLLGEFEHRVGDADTDSRELTDDKDRDHSDQHRRQGP